MGLEMSGVVEAVGEAVADFKPGDRVWYAASFGFLVKVFTCSVPSLGQCSSWWRRLRRVLLDPQGYGHPCTMHDIATSSAYSREYEWQVPDGMSFEDAAAIPEAFLTAWQALKWIGGLAANQRVLIHAGVRFNRLPLPRVAIISKLWDLQASGVGTSAIQLAKQFEHVQVITTASKDKLSFCRELGADEAIDRHENEGRWVDKVLRVTEGKGVDIIIDFVGASYWEQNLAALAMGTTSSTQLIDSCPSHHHSRWHDGHTRLFERLTDTSL